MTAIHRLLVPLGVALVLAFVVRSIIMPACDDAGSTLWGVTCDE